MTTILGEGDFKYRVDMEWAKLPDGWSFRDVAAVAVDSKDQVYVFNRGEHPMVVFDRDGNFLRSWGEGLFNRPHGLHISADDMLFCTDDGDHTLRKCTPEGKVLMTIGTVGKPSPYVSGEPFHRCTHSAQSPEGDLYVSDGYGNARVHKYSADGKLLFSWGEPGTDPGQFNIPHNICCDADGWVYVADRENHRVQVFNGDGKFETQWHNMHRPCGICMSCVGETLFYVGELGPGMNVNLGMPNIGPRLSILKGDGTALARLGALPEGEGASRFIAPHGLAADRHGDIYVGEVSFTHMINMGNEPAANFPTLRKLVKV